MDTPELKVCLVLKREAGKPTQVALFANGKVGEWADAGDGLPHLVAAIAEPLCVEYTVGTKRQAVVAA